MATTSNRKIVVSYSGDVEMPSFSYDAAENAASPGNTELWNLISGANTITLPIGTVKGCVIIPPTGNTQTLTLKGVSGDTGISLHKTDPFSLSFGTAPASIILTAGGTITGLRVFWT